MSHAYKKLIPVVLAVASLSFAVVPSTSIAAQTVQGAELKADLAERHKAFMAQANQRLQLTDAQRPEFERIVKHDAQQKHAAMQKNSPNGSIKEKRALRAEIHQIDAATDNQLSKVLNEKQLAEYKLMRKENREKAVEAMKHHKQK